jgi:hypothetical protein
VVWGCGADRVGRRSLQKKEKGKTRTLKTVECGTREKVGAADLAESGLVGGEELGIFDRAVVMDLAPLGVDAAIDARGPEVKIEASFSGFQVGFQMAAFAANRVENIVKDMQGVIVKLHGDFVRAVEDALVNRFDVLPAAFDSTEGIVHGDFLGGVPVVGHAREVAFVESAVELCQGLDWLGEIGEIFATGDDFLDGGGGGHR